MEETKVENPVMDTLVQSQVVRSSSGGSWNLEEKMQETTTTTTTRHAEFYIIITPIVDSMSFFSLCSPALLVAPTTSISKLLRPVEENNVLSKRAFK